MIYCLFINIGDSQITVNDLYVLAQKTPIYNMCMKTLKYIFLYLGELKIGFSILIYLPTSAV